MKEEGLSQISAGFTCSPPSCLTGVEIVGLSRRSRVVVSFAEWQREEI